MALLAALLAFVAIALFVWLLLAPKPSDLEDRLRVLTQRENGQEEPTDLSTPFRARVIAPLFKNSAQTIARLLPHNYVLRTRERLVMAGGVLGNSAGGFFLLRAGAGVILAFFTVCLWIGAKGSVDTKGLAIAVALLGLGIMVPEVWLQGRISRRQADIEKSLSDAMDMLTICVEAGLSLNAALSRVAEKLHGPIAMLFSQALNEMRLGKPRGQALRDMAERTGVQSLVSIASALAQADKMGVSIAQVLRVQSDQLRQTRRQKAEESAMKAPVKILLPLVFFIFPAMFIVLLGPAAMQLVDTFGS